MNQSHLQVLSSMDMAWRVPASMEGPLYVTRLDFRTIHTLPAFANNRSPETNSESLRRSPALASRSGARGSGWQGGREPGPLSPACPRPLSTPIWGRRSSPDTGTPTSAGMERRRWSKVGGRGRRRWWRWGWRRPESFDTHYVAWGTRMRVVVGLVIGCFGNGRSNYLKYLSVVER